MATSEKLELLRQTKADLKAALTEKGQSPGNVFSQYPDMVRAIETKTEVPTPEIAVSENGLITATAGDKSATKQLSTQSGKTITPGPTEQIAVAAGKYVTEDIIVAAVQSSGGNGGSGGDESAYVVNVLTNISAKVSVIAAEPPKTHALYNGVRLPKISEEVLAEYPYAVITNVYGAYYLDVSTNKTYFQSRLQIPPSSAAYSVSEDAWSLMYTNPTSASQASAAAVVVWSNHDIPNNSTDDPDDIYFEGTDPVPTD